MKQRQLSYDPRHDFYEILGVELNATPAQIQQAYRQKAKTLHPDLNPERRAWATEQFQWLNEAYAVLNNPALRHHYDQLRWIRARKPGQNWWDVPHPSEPGYNGVYSNYDPYTPPQYRYQEVQRGLWLHRLGLGFLRPFYAATVDLMLSPYRYLLILLGLIMIGNLLFILLKIA